MIRQVNLIDHLPPYVQNYREIQAIIKAEEPEIQSIEDISEIVKNNMFVSHTDEIGIERYEKMFGITPSKSDSLRSRQAMVLTKYTDTVIYTLRGLVERLDVICGHDNYTLTLIPDEYKININLDIRVAKLNGVVSSMLEKMMPANILCAYTINYNTHEVLSKYPTYLLMQFTHQELHDESIEDNISVTCDNIANYQASDVEGINCKILSTYGMKRV